MARYGKVFRTRKGRLGRYKYLRGRKVGFVPYRSNKFKYNFRRKVTRRPQSFKRWRY